MLTSGGVGDNALNLVLKTTVTVAVTETYSLWKGIKMFSDFVDNEMSAIENFSLSSKKEIGSRLLSCHFHLSKYNADNVTMDEPVCFWIS